MKKTTASALSVLAAALIFGVAPAHSADASPSRAAASAAPVQTASIQGPTVQGPIVMGRSVALRRKTKLHHLKAKPLADAAPFEGAAAVE